MPRRRRSNKRREILTPAELFVLAIDEGLPPNPLVRRGPDELDDDALDDERALDGSSESPHFGEGS